MLLKGRSGFIWFCPYLQYTGIFRYVNRCFLCRKNGGIKFGSALKRLTGIENEKKYRYTIETMTKSNRNYQKELDALLKELHIEKNGGPRLLLHSCCAPCSSYCMEYLRDFFQITVFYYNPNITEEEEYRKRVREEIRLIEAYNRQVDAYEKRKQKEPALTEWETVGGMTVTDSSSKIEVIEGDYEPERFFQMAKGLEGCPEGGERCFHCYELRLRKTAELAKKKGFDHFTTTLSISPLKNAEKLNEIGERLAEEYGVKWLPSDFKKRGGYQRSIELSREFGLYRQNYCGCIFSRKARFAETAAGSVDKL